MAGVLDDYVRRPRAVELVVRAVDTGDSRRGEETRRDELLIRIRLCNLHGLNVDDRNRKERYAVREVEGTPIVHQNVGPPDLRRGHSHLPNAAVILRRPAHLVVAPILQERD